MPANEDNGSQGVRLLREGGTPLGTVMLGETFTAFIAVASDGSATVDSISAALEDAHGVTSNLPVTLGAGEWQRPGETVAAVPLDIYAGGNFAVHVCVDRSGGDHHSEHTVRFEAVAPLALRTRVTELSPGSGVLTVRVAAQLTNTLPDGEILPPVLLLESVRLESSAACVRVYGPLGRNDADEGGAAYAGVLLGAGDTHQLVFDVDAALPTSPTVEIGRLDICWVCASPPMIAHLAGEAPSAAADVGQRGRLQTAPLVHSVSSGPVWAWLRIVRECADDTPSGHESIQATRGVAAECVVANGSPVVLSDAHLVYRGGRAFPVGPWRVPVPVVGPSASIAVPVPLRVPIVDDRLSAEFCIESPAGVFPVAHC